VIYRFSEQFIQGMLTNVGALPLERINSMLKFVPGYDRTPDQLAMYLESAKRERLVTVKDGLWSLTPEGKVGK
jgi:anaphase-promoting complex subunit 2